VAWCCPSVLVKALGSGLESSSGSGGTAGVLGSLLSAFRLGAAPCRRLVGTSGAVDSSPVLKEGRPSSRLPRAASSLVLDVSKEETPQPLWAGKPPVVPKLERVCLCFRSGNVL